MIDEYSVCGHSLCDYFGLPGARAGNQLQISRRPTYCVLLGGSKVHERLLQSGVTLADYATRPDRVPDVGSLVATLTCKHRNSKEGKNSEYIPIETI